MAIFSPPTTFVASTSLTAAGLNDNLDALAETLSQGFTSAADIEANAVTSDKILRPRIVVTPDAMSAYMQTGSIHRLRYQATEWRTSQGYNKIPFRGQTYTTRQQNLVTADQAGWTPVPGTWQSFYLEEDALAVIIRISCEIVAPNYAGSVALAQNGCYIRYDTTNFYESMCKWQLVTIAPGAPGADHQRRLIQTCAILTSGDGLDAGWHSVGLAVGMTTNFGLVGGVTSIIEALY